MSTCLNCKALPDSDHHSHLADLHRLLHPNTPKHQMLLSQQTVTNSVSAVGVGHTGADPLFLYLKYSHT